MDYSLILEAVLYSIIGIVIFFVAFLVVEKITHYSIQKEIVEKQNVAMAIVIGSLAIGISIIVAFAHG